MRPTRALACACLLLASCGAGTSVVEVSVVTVPGTVLPSIDRLRVTVTRCASASGCSDGNGASATPVDITVGREIPPSVDFALAFDKDVSGAIWIEVDANSGSSSTLAHAGVAVEVVPSRSVSATVKLTGSAPPDMAPRPADMAPRPPCDPVAQTGCSSITEKCSVNGRCEPNGSVGIGQACTKITSTSDDCAKGGTCDNGICRRMCTVDNDCGNVTGPGTNNRARCVDFLNVTPHRCSTPCNPVLGSPSGCNAGLMCLYSRDATGEFTNCVPQGTATLDCTGVRCIEGSSCVVGATTGTTTCHYNCLLNDPNACPVAVGRPPLQCVAYGGTGARALGYGFCCPTTGC